MSGYGQFCPVAKAAEVLGERWTPLVIRELVAGSQRFNDIRRGVPLMSPSLLSKRLRALEAAGVVQRAADDSRVRYRLTAAGRELETLIDFLGHWGNRWVRSHLEEDDLDAGLLMWDIGRNAAPSRLPRPGAVVQFEFSDAPTRWRYFWLMFGAGGAQLCLKDPGQEIDLLVRSSVASLAAYWIGSKSSPELRKCPDFELLGDSRLTETFPSWLGRSVFA